MIHFKIDILPPYFPSSVKRFTSLFTIAPLCFVVSSVILPPVFDCSYKVTFLSLIAHWNLPRSLLRPIMSKPSYKHYIIVKDLATNHGHSPSVVLLKAIWDFFWPIIANSKLASKVCGFFYPSFPFQNSQNSHTVFFQTVFTSPFAHWIEGKWSV